MLKACVFVTYFIILSFIIRPPSVNGCVCGLCIQWVNAVDWWTVNNDRDTTHRCSVQPNLAVFHRLYYRRRFLRRRSHVSSYESTRLSRHVSAQFLLTDVCVHFNVLQIK